MGACASVETDDDDLAALQQEEALRKEKQLAKKRAKDGYVSEKDKARRVVYGEARCSVRSQVDILLAAENGVLLDVQLVCRELPERLKEVDYVRWGCGAALDCGVYRTSAPLFTKRRCVIKQSVCES